MGDPADPLQIFLASVLCAQCGCAWNGWAKCRCPVWLRAVITDQQTIDLCLIAEDTYSASPRRPLSPGGDCTERRMVSKETLLLILKVPKLLCSSQSVALGTQCRVIHGCAWYKGPLWGPFQTARDSASRPASGGSRKPFSAGIL